MLQCRKCQIEKNEHEFYESMVKSRLCKECHKKDMRENREKNYDKIAEKNKTDHYKYLKGLYRAKIRKQKHRKEIKELKDQIKSLQDENDKHIRQYAPILPKTTRNPSLKYDPKDVELPKRSKIYTIDAPRGLWSNLKQIFRFTNP